MIETIIIVGGAIVAGLGGVGMLSSMIYTVKEKQEVLIESFGKYQKTVQSAGLKFKLPAPFQTVAERVPMELFQQEEKLQTKTKDDIFVAIPIKMHIQVTDSKKFHYETNDPIEQVKTRIAATLKQLSAQMDFAELYQAREILSDRAREAVGKEIEDLYGMKLVDVIIDEPHAPAEIQTSYNNVKASERNMLAAKNNAEAAKVARITEAEADKISRILRGEGAAGERKAILDGYAEQFNTLAQKGISSDEARRLIEIAMISDTIRDAATKGNLIVTTTNTNDALAQFGAVSKAVAKAPVIPSNDDGDSHSAPAVKGPKQG